MKALILEAPQQLEVRDIPKPKIRTGEVLIRVAACGICGSDIRYYLGDNPWSVQTLGVQLPNPSNIVLGHELAGTIEKCSPYHPDLKPGDRVCVLAYKGCGQCTYCTTGRENLCAQTEHLGHGAGWDDIEYCPGGMAEYCLAWADKVYRLPDTISFAEATFLDGLAVAVHASKRANIRSGDRVLIHGCGPIGLMMAQLALTKDAADVVCVDVQAKPLELARHYGVEGLTVVELDALPDERFDVILDSVGQGDRIPRLLALLARGGTLVFMAVKNQSLVLNHLALAGERTITGSANNRYDCFPEAIELMASGKVRVVEMITHTFPLVQAQEGFAMMLNKDAHDAFKIIIEP